MRLEFNIIEGSKFCGITKSLYHFDNCYASEFDELDHFSVVVILSMLGLGKFKISHLGVSFYRIQGFCSLYRFWMYFFILFLGFGTKWFT